MKLFLLLFFRMHLFVVMLFGVACAQEKSGKKLLRIYEDNDFLNMRGHGTDRAYSGGNRLDLFIERARKPFLIPGFVNIPQDSMTFFNQWGAMQMVFTPSNIADPYFQPHDYFYSGSLFLTHSSYAYNRSRNYSFQTELQAGIRGPYAFGRETQTWVHRMLAYRLPKGWDHQLKTAPVLNLNFTFEKQVAAVGSWLELIAGTKLRMGTFENGISVYPLLRIGIMAPYFSGFINQYSGGRVVAGKKRKMQAYLVISPEAKWMLTNAMLQTNGLLKRKEIKPISDAYANTEANSYNRQNIIRHFIFSVNYGAVISTGKFAISYMQNTSTEMRKNTYSHEFGNISLYFTL